MFTLQTLLRNYEGDIESLTKQQKQAVEKAEMTQTTDQKVAAKKLKQDQVCVCRKISFSFTSLS